MLTLSDMVILFPRWTRSILPFWRRFVQAWDDLYNIGTYSTVWMTWEVLSYVQLQVCNAGCVGGSQGPHRQEDRGTGSPAAPWGASGRLVSDLLVVVGQAEQSRDLCHRHRAAAGGSWHGEEGEVVWSLSTIKCHRYYAVSRMDIMRQKWIRFRFSWIKYIYLTRTNCQSSKINSPNLVPSTKLNNSWNCVSTAPAPLIHSSSASLNPKLTHVTLCEGNDAEKNMLQQYEFRQHWLTVAGHFVSFCSAWIKAVSTARLSDAHGSTEPVWPHSSARLRLVHASSTTEAVTCSKAVISITAVLSLLVTQHFSPAWSDLPAVASYKVWVVCKKNIHQQRTSWKDLTWNRSRVLCWCLNLPVCMAQYEWTLELLSKLLNKLMSLRSFLLLSDIQHFVVDFVPFSSGPYDPGSTVQGGGACVSGQTCAKHWRPEPDALSEGRHQGDVAVSWSLPHSQLVACCPSADVAAACVVSHCGCMFCNTTF